MCHIIFYVDDTATTDTFTYCRTLALHHALPISALVVLGLAGPVAAEPVKLSLLHINDIDRIQDSNGRGGLARLMTLVNRERAAAEPAIFTHGGDTIPPSLLAGLDPGAHINPLLPNPDIDILLLGQHHLDFAPALTSHRIANTPCPLPCPTHHQTTTHQHA